MYMLIHTNQIDKRRNYDEGETGKERDKYKRHTSDFLATRKHEL
jgi:hypothetical protein